MAEITRKKQKIFAGSLSASGNIAVYGSKLAGTPAYSDNIDNIQSARWGNGVMGATSSDKAPYVQDLNAIFYTITKQLAYIFQAGIPEWEANTEYFAGKSVVLRSGKAYIALQNNTNIQPEVTTGWGTYWKNLLNWGDVKGDLFEQTDLWQAFVKGLFYNADFVTAKGGYALGDIIYFNDTYGNTFKIKSLIANNNNAPSLSNIKFNSSSSTGTYYWQAIIEKSPLDLEYFGICDTSGSQTEKVVNISNFVQLSGSIPVGTKVRVLFNHENTVKTEIDLKIVGSKGSFSAPIKVFYDIDTFYNLDNEVVEFWWDGLHWVAQNIVVREVTGKSWYRIFRSGFVEQGGTTYSVTQGNYITVSFSVTMKDTNYCIALSAGIGSGSGSTNNTMDSISKTGFRIFTGSPSYYKWFVCGLKD